MQTKPVGFTLILIGIMMLVYTGYYYFTPQKGTDEDAIEIGKEKEHSIKWPSVVSIILIAGGIVIISRGKKGGI